MAAGTYTTQNKVRPGIYVNFESQPRPVGGFSDRGTVTIPLALSWGAPQTVMTVEAGEDTFGKFGYSLTDAKLRLLQEALKRAKTLLIYRLNTGTKAAITSEGLTVTAQWGVSAATILR